MRPVPGAGARLERKRAAIGAFAAREHVAADFREVAERLVDLRRRRAVGDAERFRVFRGVGVGGGG